MKCFLQLILIVYFFNELTSFGRTKEFADCSLLLSSELLVIPVNAFQSNFNVAAITSEIIDCILSIQSMTHYTYIYRWDPIFQRRWIKCRRSRIPVYEQTIFQHRQANGNPIYATIIWTVDTMKYYFVPHSTEQLERTVSSLKPKWK